jgi:threonine/homoserine/homoserine lactone efflux protein
VIRTAVLINLLNPKLTIFFFAFLPQFVHPGEHATTRHMVGLSLVFMAVTFIVFTLYGYFAASMRRFVLGRPRWSPGCVGRSRPPMSCSPDVWPCRTASCRCGSGS